MYPFLALRALYTERINLVIKWIGSGKKVLDVGGGDGSISERIRLEGNDVVLFDFPEAVQRSFRYPKLQRIAGDATGIDAKLFGESWGGFDVVIALELIEHYEDPGRLLAEWAGPLRSGGSLILSTPDGKEASLKHPTHKTYFDRRSLGNLVREKGLAVRRSEHIKSQATLVLEAVKP
jgi:2-polyprenyl-3-methyl-5-hydroxy-6-metoxy-1,4-benzoquinol methylase